MYPMMIDWWKQVVDAIPSTLPSSVSRHSPYKSAFDIQTWPFETALCRVGEELCLQESSRNFREVTGCAALMGSDFHLLLHQDAQKAFFFNLQKMLFTPVSGSYSLGNLRLKTSSPRYAEICAIADRDGFYFTLRDVTAVVEQERELVRSRINTELALRTRSEFLGRMSHELRTPLNAVIGFAQMIDSRVHGPLGHATYEEYLRSILESGEHLLEKIDNLVAISEAELGAVEPEEEPCSLHDLFLQASDHHQHYAFSKDIQLGIDGESCDLQINADRALLTKALSSVIENALAATEPRGKVSLSCKANAAGDITIEVRDTGIGMSENLVRCLRSFFQGALLNTSHYDQIPLGTGLVLVREYMLLHQGHATLDSHKGEGTAVQLHLPSSRLFENKEPVRQALAV